MAGYLTVEHPQGAPRLTPAWAQGPLGVAARPRCIPVLSAAALEAPSIQLLGWQLDRGGSHALWWTDGSALVEPSWVMAAGLPDPSSYSAMLDGAWAHSSWDVAETEIDPTSTIARAHSDDDTVIVARSAALTDRGPVRTVNQDAFIEHGEQGLWAVADGMGGLSDGEIASRMVCDSLNDVPPVADLDEAAEAVIRQARQVNDYLRRAATRPVNPVQSGSTVVVLVIRRKECALLWAGDSRVYRLRDGLLSQLTTDHSWAAQFGGADEQTITRAVGAEDVLNLEVLRSDVRAGDRFLLCSDGIGRVLDIAALTDIMHGESPERACADLVSQSIAHGGTDNLTALVVHCDADRHDILL